MIVTGERREIARAVSSNREEEMSSSTQMEELVFARGSSRKKMGVDAGRWLHTEMGIRGNYHLSVYIFLGILEASSWAQSKGGNLRRDKKV